MQQEEISELIRDLHSVAIKRDLTVDVIRLYQTFYEQHKMKYGSFKAYEGESYQRYMQERYDYIFCCINDVIESQIKNDILPK